MKFLLASVLLISFIFLAPISSAATRVSTAKKIVSSESKIIKKTKVSLADQKKKKLTDRASMVKKVEELASKLRTILVEIEVAQVKVNVLKMTNQKGYLSALKELVAARQAKTKLEDEIKSINKLITTTDLWLKRNP